MNQDIVDRFVEAWGAMGSLWGINPSVARIHALLIITERPWSLDEIGERLTISKSNASMSLKELRSWKVVRQVRQPGDRREFYTCEPDTWQMLFSIIRERKRREFDPILEQVRASRALAESEPDGIAVARLQQMEQMLVSFEKLAGRFLASGEHARSLLTFLLGRV